MELRNLSLEDSQSLAILAKEEIPSRYYVTEETIKRKLLLHPCFSKEASFGLWEGEECAAFIGVKLPNCPQILPDTGWISIVAVKKELQRNGFGTMLLGLAEDALKDIGIKKFIVGQDFAGFFSGLPEVTEELCGFFRKNGYEVSDDSPYYDLEGNVLENPWMDAYEENQEENFCEVWDVRTLNEEDETNAQRNHVADEDGVCTFNKEETALLSFLEQEFPGRWKYEVETALQAGKPHEEIVLLWNRDHTQVHGFCMLGQEPDGRGKLGPIGISRSSRGKGIGEYFLYKCLEQLKKLGRDRVNIDWTVLTKFYGKFGFAPERTYCGASKEL